MGVDYKKIGLKAGLELHLQLDTKHKLFCKCSTSLQEKTPVQTVVRKLHVVQSELGAVDIAAEYEYLRDRTFYYQLFPNETCEVELDAAPPMPVNREALQIALTIALLLKCSVPDEVQVVRKIIIDGSSPQSFQRSMIVGLEGLLKYQGKRILITHVSLEEDSAPKVKEENGKVTYRLNRLGIPLVEIGTGILEDFTPKQVEEVAYRIGMTCRLTGKIKRGPEAIRQDVNVSIAKGARVEIKGVAKLGLISKVVEYEVQRQLNLLRLREELKKRGLRKLITHAIDVTSLFKKTKCRVIAKLLKEGANVYAIKLPKFAGLLAFELCPGRSFAKELVDRAGDLIHSDEDLREYALDYEFAQLCKHLNATKEDAIIVLAAKPTEAAKRIRWLIQRCQQALQGVPKETRTANPDGTTCYTRPLPGAARIYPETDLKPVLVTQRMLRLLRTTLPETLETKIKRFKTKLKLPENLISQILKSEYLELFENITKSYKVKPTLIATTFISCLKDLRRKGVAIEAIRDEHFYQLFDALQTHEVVKEAIPDVLTYLAKKPEKNVKQAIADLNLKPLGPIELKNIVRETWKKFPHLPKEKVFGLIMSKVRGKANVEDVKKTLEELR